MKTQGGEVESADGTRVRYEVEGHGSRCLVLTNGLTTTSTFWKYLKPRWAQHHRVLTWDLPGHGTSGPARSPASASIEGQPPILAKIMDAAGIPSAVHIGFSMGCQVVLEMYKQYPARCEALVAILGGAGRVLSNTRFPLVLPSALSALMHTSDAVFAPGFAAFTRAADSSVGQRIGRLLGLLGPSATDGDLREVTAHLRTLDAPTMRRMACSAEAHSALDVLAHLDVPLLIVTGDRDPFAPPRLVGLPMHRAAPRSELVRLPRGTHTALLDEPEVIARAVDAFLGRLQGHQLAASG